MGKTRLRFTVVSAPLRGQQAELDADQPIHVGRTADNQLVLDHKSVSRRHARLEPNGSDYRLVDLDSHNGTLVGDQPITERAVRPGDILGFGEVRVAFEAVAAGEPAPTADLPVLLPSQPGQEMAVARPLTIAEVFAQAAAAQPIESAAAAPRYRGTLLYALTILGVIVVGAVAYWRVGYRPPKPPVVEVQLRAGDLRPINVAPRVDPVTGRWVKGLNRITEVGEPEDEQVAYATKTRYRTFVTVHGKSVGQTDIPLYGEPERLVILRVLVRGVKPEPESEAWMRQPPPERKRRANALIDHASSIALVAGVDENTSKAIREFETAAQLLEAISGEGAKAIRSAEKARELRERLEARYDYLSRQIDILRAEGKLKECEEMARELLALFNDPETEEYHVVRLYYDSLADELAQAQREAEEQR